MKRSIQPYRQPIDLDITEVGIDLWINQGEGDRERIAYFDKLFQVI